MKLKSTECPDCMIEANVGKESFINEINSDGIYLLNCKNGHNWNFIIQHFDFELLYEIGMHALTSGFYDASISRFAVSLERFYEFIIKIHLLSCGHSFSSMQALWKKIDKNSQCQLGAFLICLDNEKLKYPESTLETPPKLEEFRNKVIHKGYIPTFEESYKYAKYVYDYINTILYHIGLNHRKIVSNYLQYVMSERRKLIKNPFEICHRAFGTTINISCSDQFKTKKDFKEVYDLYNNHTHITNLEGA